MVKYETEIAYRRAESINRQANINIGTVSGNSVIGSQENVIMNIGHGINDIKKIIDALPSDEQVTGQGITRHIKIHRRSNSPGSGRGRSLKIFGSHQEAFGPSHCCRQPGLLSC